MGPDVTGRGLQQVQHEAGRSCYGAQHAEGGDTTRREIQRAQTSMGSGFGGRKLRQAETLAGVNFSGRRRQSAQTSAGADVSGRSSQRAHASAGAGASGRRRQLEPCRPTSRSPDHPTTPAPAWRGARPPRRKNTEAREPRLRYRPPDSRCARRALMVRPGGRGVAACGSSSRNRMDGPVEFPT